MYGKIFDSIYDGTLVEDWRALVAFQQMIVLCDSDGVVDMTPSAISRRTGIPIEHIKEGIKILEEPDPWSRTPDEEGRRIIRLDKHREWGWQIVNHQKYKGLQDYDTVKQQNRERQRKRREKLSGNDNNNGSSRPVTEGHTHSRHTDKDINTHTDTKAQSARGFILPAKIDSNDLPSWWNSEAWSEWCDYRASVKKKISPQAATKQFNELERYCQTPDDMRAVIDHSISNDYIGLFPSKITGGNNGESSGGSKPKSSAERVWDSCSKSI